MNSAMAFFHAAIAISRLRGRRIDMAYCSFSVGSAIELRHAMYEADPRRNPARLEAELRGLPAASGKTRFGKNRVVSPEI